MIDTHSHFGQFNQHYTYAADIVKYMNAVGVDIFAACPTTVCNGNHDSAFKEMKELIVLAGDCVIPILWITPNLLESKAIEEYIEAQKELRFKWECLKIHPHLNPGLWTENDRHTKDLLALANMLRLPILIHTGETEGCYPNEFKSIIENNHHITFILAHGRPIDQTISIMKANVNCWTDTAFMPVENIVKLCDEGLSDRVLWGSDYPIFGYYDQSRSLVDIYAEKLAQLQAAISSESFLAITSGNAVRLFNLNSLTQ